MKIALCSPYPAAIDPVMQRILLDPSGATLSAEGRDIYLVYANKPIPGCEVSISFFNREEFVDMTAPLLYGGWNKSDVDCAPVEKRLQNWLTQLWQNDGGEPHRVGGDPHNILPEGARNFLGAAPHTFETYLLEDAVEKVLEFLGTSKGGLLVKEVTLSLHIRTLPPATQIVCYPQDDVDGRMVRSLDTADRIVVLTTQERAHSVIDIAYLCDVQFSPKSKKTIYAIDGYDQSLASEPMLSQARAAMEASLARMPSEIVGSVEPMFLQTTQRNNRAFQHNWNAFLSQLA